MNARLSNYVAWRIRHCVDSIVHSYVDVGHQSMILVYKVVERSMNNKSLNFRLYERARPVKKIFS